MTQENGLIRLLTPRGAVKTLPGSFNNAYFGLAGQAPAITFTPGSSSGSISGDAKGNVFFNSGRSVYKLFTQP